MCSSDVVVSKLKNIHRERKEGVFKVGSGKVYYKFELQ
jgi:hypothetical protein